MPLLFIHDITAVGSLLGEEGDNFHTKIKCFLRAAKKKKAKSESEIYGCSSIIASLWVPKD